MPACRASPFPHPSGTEQTSSPCAMLSAARTSATPCGAHRSSYLKRLASCIDASLFTAAHDFSRDGLYLYKRPVRSATPDHAALLAQGGTAFHHCVVYVKRGDQVGVSRP